MDYELTTSFVCRVSGLEFCLIRLRIELSQRPEEEFNFANFFLAKRVRAEVHDLIPYRSDIV